jgi:hypothetical protein
VRKLKRIISFGIIAMMMLVNFNGALYANTEDTLDTQFELPEQSIHTHQEGSHKCHETACGCAHDENDEECHETKCSCVHEENCEHVHGDSCHDCCTTEEDGKIAVSASSIREAGAAEGISFVGKVETLSTDGIMGADSVASLNEIKTQIPEGIIGDYLKTNSTTGNVLYACVHQFNGSYIITKAAKCTTTGTKVGKCTKCGAVISTVTIPALGHTGSWVTNKSATCTVAGMKTMKCTRCGVTQSQSIPATGHTFNGSFTITKAATCTAEGTKVGKCTKCSVVVSTVSIPALGHSYGSWSVASSPTCTTAGVNKRTCSRCGVSQTQSIGALGHTFNGSFTVTKAATCTAEGTKVGKCDRCGVVVTTVSIPALGHSYGSWSVASSPTCTTAGVNKRTCSRCGVSQTQSIAATGHIFNGSFTITKAATCTAEGTKVGKCEKCGTVVTTVSIPKLEHTGAWITSRAATCTVDGIKTRKCDNCGTMESQSITATGHVFNGSFNTVKKPTCTEDGINEGRCTKCNEVVATASIPKLSNTGHIFNGIFTLIKAPTCTQEGTKVGKCEKCEEVVTTVSIPKLEHTGAWITSRAATCTVDGIKTRKCDNCGTMESQSITATGHVFNGSFNTVKKPTCTEDGINEGRCTRCNEVVATVKIPKLSSAGHVFNGIFTLIKAATCTQEGTKVGKCERCEEIVTRVSIPPSHKFTNSSLSITPKDEILIGAGTVGDAVHVEAVCTACGEKVDLTDKVTYSSSNSSVATVSGGRIKSGPQKGTATITASYLGNKAVCTVRVEIPGDPRLRALKFTPESETLTEYNKRGSKVKVLAVYDTGEFDVTNNASFTSGNRDIAYIDQGYIKSGLKRGSTLITARYEGLTATCNVTVDMDADVETKPLRLGKTVGFTIPEDLPVIGGTELDFNMDFIPASLSFGKEEFKIAIGVEDVQSVDKNWADFKKTFEEAKGRISDVKNFRSQMSKFGKKVGKFNVTKKWKPSMDVFGYIEGVMINGVPIVNRGSIVFMVKAEYTNQTQYMLGPVPVYFEIGGGVKLESISEIIRYLPDSGALKLNSELKITPRFEIGGGVGVAKVLTVGGSGEAELEFKIRDMDNYLKITLTGRLNLKATALFFSAEKTIAQGTWNLYESSSGTRGVAPASPDTDFNVYNTDEYSIMSRDYINRPSSWNGGGQKLRGGAANFTNKEMNVLGTNIYPDAQPQLVNYGERQVLVWVADNTERTSSNRTMLVYSVYDKDKNQWSVPAAVDDDGTADFYPQLAQDGNDLYVVWQNSNKTFSDNTTLEEVAGSGEIAVSKFDGETNTFGSAVKLTENNTVDTLPQLAISGGKVYAVWISNNENDIFGVKGKNSIYYSELTDGKWSSPAILCENLNAVPSISAGFIEDAFTVAYALDEDNVLETINDREIYTVRPGSASARLTNNDTLDSSPVFSGFNGTGTLYWYTQGNISYLSKLDAVPGQVFSNSKPGFQDNFKVLAGSNDETAIIWPNTQKGISEIYATIYDSAKGEWSEAVKISDIGSEILSPNGVFDSNGNFSIVFSKITQLEDDTEQTDLCILKVIPSYNLTVNSVVVDHSRVIPGTELPIDVEIGNKGELAVEEVVVDILDENEIVNSFVMKAGIKPGETKTVTVSMNLPETIDKKTYSIKVTAVDGDEYDTTDNTKEFVIGYTDVSVQLERYSEGNTEFVTAHVINLSHVPSAAVLKVTKGSEDGEVIDTRTIESGTDMAAFQYKFDKDILCAGKDSEILYFTVTADKEELYKSDNSKYIALTIDKSPTIMYGDVNADGKITSTDFALIQRYVLGMITKDGFKKSNGEAYPEGYVAADVNGTRITDPEALEIVTSTDLAYVKRFILGMIKEFPVESM